MRLCRIEGKGSLVKSRLHQKTGDITSRGWRLSSLSGYRDVPVSHVYRYPRRIGPVRLSSPGAFLLPLGPLRLHRIHQVEDQNLQPLLQHRTVHRRRHWITNSTILGSDHRLCLRSTRQNGVRRRLSRTFCITLRRLQINPLPDTFLTPSYRTNQESYPGCRVP